MAVELNKINSFVEDLANKKINLGGNGLTVALTNTAHTASWSKLSDLTEVSYTYCSDRKITVTSSAQASGTYKLVLSDLTLTASGGSVGAFRYIYIYDDNSSDDSLCWYYDYGSSITLNDTDTFSLKFDGTNGVITIA